MKCNITPTWYFKSHGISTSVWGSLQHYECPKIQWGQLTFLCRHNGHSYWINHIKLLVRLFMISVSKIECKLINWICFDLWKILLRSVFLCTFFGEKYELAARTRDVNRFWMHADAEESVWFQMPSAKWWSSKSNLLTVKKIPASAKPSQHLIEVRRKWVTIQFNVQ